MYSFDGCSPKFCLPRRTILRVVVVCLAGTFIDVSAEDLRDQEHPLFIDGTCFAISASNDSLTPGAAANYSSISTLKKTDILCVGDTIQISQALHSWGGDITVYATKLVLRAPIDSRVHFQQHFDAATNSGINHFQGGYTEVIPGNFNNPLPVPSANEIGPPTTVPGAEATTVASLRRIVQTYYDQCNDCETGSSSALIPQFPAGLLPATHYGGGLNLALYQQRVYRGMNPMSAANFTADATRSGSITIITGDLEVSPDLLSGQVGSSELCVDDNEKPRPFAFNAGGLRGGRGGLGSIPFCAGAKGCAEPGLRGASGPPGPGGPAGNILVVRVAKQPDAAFLALVGKASNVQGGAGGPRSQLLWPATLPDGFNTLPFVPTCQLPRNGLISPAANAGADGALDIKSASSPVGFGTVYSAAIARDARGDYQLKDFAKRAAEKNQTLASESHILFVNHKLAEAVLAGQARVAQTMFDSFIATHVVPARSSSPWTILHGVEPTNLPPAVQLDVSTYQVLRDWPVVDLTDDNRLIEQFFLRSGGTVNIDDADAFQRFLSEATRIDLGKVLTLDAAQLAALESIKSLVAESMLNEREYQMRAKIDSLKQSLQTLQAKANANNQGGFLTGLISAIAHAIDPLQGLFDALVSGGLKEVVDHLGPVGQSLEQVYSSVTVTQPQVTNIPELQVAIDAALTELTLFLNAADEIRAANSRSEAFVLLRQLRERGALRAKLDARIAIVPDLLKLTFTSFAQDPSHNYSLAASNSLAVITFARNFPDQEPVFRFRGNTYMCSYLSSWDFLNNRGRCKQVAGDSSSDRTVYFIDAPEIISKLPAFVISASGRRIIIDSFGFEIATQEMPSGVYKPVAQEPPLRSNPRAGPMGR